MPTIREERLKIWSSIGESMAGADAAGAKLKMDVFCANFQEIQEAVDELSKFKEKIDKEYDDQMKKINTGTSSLNPLQKHLELGGGLSEIEWWRTRELYYFLYRLAHKYKMFPEGTIDYRPERVMKGPKRSK